uniref:Probable flap endonuclease 1 homolog n=1 Tax=Gouania willdenowi TaxID=441366 RepID=A0A8C5DGV1_GOUWI
MGITKLADLIRSDAPEAISHKSITDYAEKVIAFDAAIVMNQFRAATPSLSPLLGLFFRTLTFLEHDIKPVFVFDGKPPVEKTAVLERRAEAMGRSPTNRTGTPSLLSTDFAQLLTHLGVPVVQAPGDAEACCAHLVREQTVDGVASEDMDTLPFGGNVLIRHLNAKRDGDIVEYSLPKLLERLNIRHQELVDLCILLGCDYCDKIPGLGPRRALSLIQEHHTIENVVLNINRETHPVPVFWKYKEARKIFLDVPQIPVPQLVWKEPNEDDLVRFLCYNKHNKEARVRHRLQTFRETQRNRREERKKERAEGRTRQTRMEEFWMVTRKREQVHNTDAHSS